jgi:Transposase DDE domain
MPPKDRVSRLVYKQALSALEEHLVIPSAPNSHYKNKDILESLVYLSIEERYAESGLEDLSSTRQESTPSADTLLYRLKKLSDWKQAYSMLISANDSALEKLRRRGVFRKPVIAAIDPSDDNYYGEYNGLLRRSKKDRGTNLFYTYASFHIVDKGRRITIFTVPVYQLDDIATICEELIKAAWIRGVKIEKLLIDRGFYSVDVMNMLGKRLKVDFLMPAIKNDRMKQAIVDYHNRLIPKMSKFTIRNQSKEEEASFRLMIYRKKDAKETDPIPEQYFVFATNVRKFQEARKLYRIIPLEYKKRWGIETGFRVQNQVKAMTTSQNYTIRIIYAMLSVIIYNLWQLANIILAARKHHPGSGIESETGESTHQADTPHKNIQTGNRDARWAASIITFGSTEVGKGI